VSAVKCTTGADMTDIKATMMSATTTKSDRIVSKDDERTMM
jgi:hypothetical protein